MNSSSKRGFDEVDDHVIEFEDPEIPMLDEDDALFRNALTQAFEDVQDPILDELSQDFEEASGFFQNLPLYYRVGSGFENQPGPSSRGPPYTENNPQANIRDALIVEERSRRKNTKYHAEEITYRVRVDTDRLPAEVRGASVTADIVRQLILQLIQRTTDHLVSTDLIRICIQAQGLDKPISTNLMTVAELTLEKVLSTVMKVLQSKDSIQLDTGFIADVITVHRPVGAGPTNQRVINIPVDRLRKKSILTIPMDDEGLCCAKAIVFAKAHLEKDQPAINAMRDRRRPALINRAKALHEAAGVPLGPCTYSEVARFEDYLDLQIVVFASECLNKVSYKGRDRSKRINLWLHDNHYDVIKSLKGFYASDHYCDSCEKPFKSIQNHRCPDACFNCLRRNCTPEQEQACKDCGRRCVSAACFQAHKATPGNQQLSLCDQTYQCRQCCKWIERRKCPMEFHQCGTVRCPSCEKFVIASEHRCHLRTIKAKTPSENLIFFDFETDQSSGTHLVNFAVAQYSEGEEFVFSGYTACDDFCAWLFQPQHKEFVAVAHNMKGFDGQFIMAWLLKQGTEPDVIPNGSLVMTIKHPSLGIRVIDSLNFLPMPLSKLPQCFGLSELKKGYFPHHFNTAENQDYIGLLPDVQFYSPDTMKPAAREAFLQWYEQHRDETFDFQQEMRDYCSSDVDILRRCCMIFRAEFLEVAKVDPFQYVTIASACMATYRAGHVKADTIAMVPVHGYVNETNYSPDSIRWLDFLAHSQGIQIQHALNSTGEHKIRGISVDGFCHATQTAYQYQGCFFHGCGFCFDGDAIHPLKRVTMATLKKKTADITERLRTLGYKVIEIWEHEFAIQKKTDPDLQIFLTSHHLEDRLRPRDAFFGGRTNAVKLFHEGSAKYVDFTSLYPWVNKYCQYPVGHPSIITENFKDVDEYFGLIRCRVVPPRGLYLPVLPHRCNKKLMFPLCRTCAEGMPQGKCCHSDAERAIVGTWVTEEVKLAKKKGYRITHIYEVYHFESSSECLFRSYIDLFLKIKQESSGWPAECESEELKAKYLREYQEKEGVVLDPAAIAKNPGRRQVAKLALNSFWGRWGMNTHHTHLKYIAGIADFNKWMADPTKTVKDMYLPTPEIAALQWESKREFLEQDAQTNIFLAAFTTAWARLKLYEEMEKLGQAVLYHDTDSIIYASDGTNDPPLGNFLGDFTDELDGDVITTFVSGGPKNYAYSTASGKTCCKVRGFTLNYRNSQKLNFEVVRNLVLSMDRTETVPLHNPAKICRDPKRRKVINRPETKLYKIVYDKRVIQEDLTTLPYGY